MKFNFLDDATLSNAAYILKSTIVFTYAVRIYSKIVGSCLRRPKSTIIYK